jgi:hypothetical protein
MRPFGEDPEWDRNQLLAFRTWMSFAKKVILFGKTEPQLENPHVEFWPTEQFPRIKDMARVAGDQARQVVVICNGDILLNPQIMKVEQRIRNGVCLCASSRRWHFKPEELPDALESATLNTQEGLDDRGRDVFVAPARVWKQVESEVSPLLRIGHQHWDGELTRIFRSKWGDKFLDFTSLRMVHHPIHGGRRMPYAETIPR